MTLLKYLRRRKGQVQDHLEEKKSAVIAELEQARGTLRNLSQAAQSHSRRLDVMSGMLALRDQVHD